LATNRAQLDCAPKDKKFAAAATYLAKHDGKPGVFLILVTKAKVPVWELKPGRQPTRTAPIDAHYAALQHQMRVSAEQKNKRLSH